MTTQTRTARYEVIGCNDEQTSCDFCPKTHLKKTVILRDHEGEIVRVGTSCAVRACAVPGVRTTAQLNTRISAAMAAIRDLEYRRDQARAVLADPARLALNAQATRNAPMGDHYMDSSWTVERERARWEASLAEVERELADRT